MLTTRFLVGMFSLGPMVLGAGLVCCQDYPNKPIRIVTSAAAGASDLVARLIAQGISGPLGQPVIVDNHAATVLQGELVFKAPPDGYTLLLTGGAFWIGSLIQKTPYDPVKDFSPITLANRQPNVLVVHPSFPAKSVSELIAMAKARPGELNYSSGGTGGSTHLAGALFMSMAGINIVRIPYGANAQETQSVIGGEVPVWFPSMGTAAPHIKSGALRALAVTSAERSTLLPDLPTVAASGLPGYESGAKSGIFAPAKTPSAIINRLNQEVVRFLNTAEAKQKFFNSGSEVVGSSPEELTATIKSELASLGKVIKDAGIKPN